MRGDRPLRTLAPDKAEQLAALFAALPDPLIAGLAAALKAGATRTAAGKVAYELLQGEQAERRIRDQVFAPLAPMVRAADASAPMPPETLAMLWRVFKADDPSHAEKTIAAVSDLTLPDEARRASDEAVQACAAALERAEGRWASLQDQLETRLPGAASALRLHLKLTPLARSCGPRVRAWMRTASPEHASALRLAYRDAAALGDDAPPRLIDMLAAHLEHRWQVLRLISAVMDRPTDRFLAASELGVFGERVLEEVDERVEAVRAFEPAGGPGAGQAAAADVCVAVAALSEFDRCVDLTPGGAWAKRLSAQRRTLSRSVEARLRQADGALAKALPVVTSGFGGQVRGAPKLDAPPDPVAQTKAAALAAFVAAVRPGADYGGFAVARANAVEAMDARLSVHADDLVRAAHERPEPDAEEARRRLVFVAECLSQIRDPRAAEVVRRRAAAA